MVDEVHAQNLKASGVIQLLGGVGPGILMSLMLLFYVLLVDKKKLVNPPMAKALLKSAKTCRWNTAFLTCATRSGTTTAFPFGIRK